MQSDDPVTQYFILYFNLYLIFVNLDFYQNVHGKYEKVFPEEIISSQFENFIWFLIFQYQEYMIILFILMLPLHQHSDFHLYIKYISSKSERCTYYFLAKDLNKKVS